ncbi:hypothetical protein ABW20_dc0107400 [Dactylellina cionopaga]|nr:hypothetical protein ABW20_dc0107400 [Dactylellina cionopaga]
MAMIARLCVGMLNGNVGILRTVVAELVPEKELQPRAFSLLPLAWNLGSILGPALGGFLSEPAQKYPTIFPKGSFFDIHPWALPNLIIAAVTFIACILGVLFLEETLTGQRDRSDPGRDMGKKIEYFFGFGGIESEKRHSRSRTKVLTVDEESPLLERQSDHSTISHSPGSSSSSTNSTSSNDSTAAPRKQDPRGYKSNHPNTPLPLSQILTPQSIYLIALYFLLALHHITYEQLLSVFFATHLRSKSDPIHLPFHIPGGFGLSTSQIGLVFSANGLIVILMQLIVYPPVARRFGSIKLLAMSATLDPLIYLIVPYTLALYDPSPEGSNWALYTVWTLILLVNSSNSAFGVTSCMILLTNTASSTRVLGTLNGFVTSVAALGLSVGPGAFGWLFTVGQKSEWTTIPWVGLALVAFSMWVWIPKVEEGKGLQREESDSDTYSGDGESNGTGAMTERLIRGDENERDELTHRARH